jgi:hypothetical protein
MVDRKEAAKSIDLVSYLSSLGHKPVRDSNGMAKYLSPFRDESHPSFIVDRNTNKWTDFGESTMPHDIIDFVQRVSNCTLPEALDILLGEEELPRFEKKEGYKRESGIEVVEVCDTITNEILIDYLQEERKIPLEIAQRYCKEVWGRFANNKAIKYVFVAMENDKGGWVLKNSWFKGSSSPAWVTTLNEGCSICNLTEGLEDFLSYEVMYGEPPATSIILNSLVFIPMIVEHLKQYDVINLLLDNDGPAEEKIDYLLQEGVNIHDARHLYKGYNDLNEMLQYERKLQ